MRALAVPDHNALRHCALILWISVTVERAPDLPLFPLVDQREIRLFGETGTESPTRGKCWISRLSASTGAFIDAAVAGVRSWRWMDNVMAHF